MSSLVIVVLLSVATMALVFVFLGIKIIIKKDGEFKKYHSSSIMTKIQSKQKS